MPLILIEMCVPVFCTRLTCLSNCFAVYVPETKGKTLSEINDMMSTASLQIGVSFLVVVIASGLCCVSPHSAPPHPRPPALLLHQMSTALSLPDAATA